MPAPKQNDSVFQLTLTELAFMLIFLMLLVTGWMVLDQGRKAREATEKLKLLESRVKQAGEDRELDAAALAIRAAIKKEGARPAELLADLKKCSVLEPENETLKARVAELDARIGVLAPFLDTMKLLSGKDNPQAAADELATAMSFRRAFEEASGKKLDGAGAVRLGWDCVAAQSRGEEYERERQDLVNQVTFMRHQLEEKEGKKGFGQPPCWVDNAGKAQRLIAVEVTEHGLVARPGWPAERAADAKKVPNLDALLAGGKPQSAAAFRAAALPILEWGRKRSPECRLYASVTVSATTVDTSVTGQNAVFDHFFPYGRVTVQKAGR